MNKYKIKHTSIMHNGSLNKEGSTIELTPEQAAKLSDFVELVREPKAKAQAKTQTQKSETKPQTKTESTDNTQGGTDGK